MKFFLDTANVEYIKEVNEMGVISGVTTNPSLVAKEGRDFNEVIKEITEIVDGPISGEVVSEDAEGMIKEGREIAKIHKNMIVKIPMTGEGLKATKVLASEGIKTNVTLIFSATQALLAANAGATYVSPFLGRVKMKFFLDTANVEYIKEVNEMGVICGVTTNPSLVAKEGRDFNEVIKEITEIVDGPISGEVVSEDAEGMIKEGREIAKIHKNMIVKIPMTGEGLKATKVLASEGIKTNVTLIFSATQALLAANAGATYVSPFLGRVDDISMIGMDLVRDIAEIFAIHGIETKIIAASVRNPIHVIEAAKAGADIATVPYELVKQMLKHPLTDQGLEKFKADWAAAFGDK